MFSPVRLLIRKMYSASDAAFKKSFMHRSPGDQGVKFGELGGHCFLWIICRQFACRHSALLSNTCCCATELQASVCKMHTTTRHFFWGGGSSTLVSLRSTFIFGNWGAVMRCGGSVGAQLSSCKTNRSVRRSTAACGWPGRAMSVGRRLTTTDRRHSAVDGETATALPRRGPDLISYPALCALCRRSPGPHGHLGRVVTD